MEPHQILGIGKYATPADIKNAFRRLAAVHHPDKGGDAEIFKEIRQAYNMMMNPDTVIEPEPVSQAPQYQYEPPPDISRFVNPFDRRPFRSSLDDPNINYWDHHMEPELEELANLDSETRWASPGYGGYEVNGTYTCNITLEQAYSGGTVKFTVPNYKPTTILIRPNTKDGAVEEVYLTPVASWLSTGKVNVRIRHLPHSVYRVMGDGSLERDLDISLLEGVTGGTRHIRFLDNSVLQVDFKGPIQSGSSRTMIGYGLCSKSSNRAGANGNYLTIIFWVKIPELTKQQIEQLKGILDE